MHSEMIKQSFNEPGANPNVEDTHRAKQISMRNPIPRICCPAFGAGISAPLRATDYQQQRLQSAARCDKRRLALQRTDLLNLKLLTRTVQKRVDALMCTLCTHSSSNRRIKPPKAEKTT